MYPRPPLFLPLARPWRGRSPSLALRRPSPLVELGLGAGVRVATHQCALGGEEWVLLSALVGVAVGRLGADDIDGDAVPRVAHCALACVVPQPRCRVRWCRYPPSDDAFHFSPPCEPRGDFPH